MAVDTTAPSIGCPDDIAITGGFGGKVVNFKPPVTDACDPSPSVTAIPPSGSFFPTGVTTVTVEAANLCANDPRGVSLTC